MKANTRKKTAHRWAAAQVRNIDRQLHSNSKKLDETAFYRLERWIISELEYLEAIATGEEEMDPATASLMELGLNAQVLIDDAGNASVRYA